MLIKTKKSTKAVQAECWGMWIGFQDSRERELTVVTAIYEKKRKVLVRRKMTYDNFVQASSSSESLVQRKSIVKVIFFHGREGK